MQIEIFYLDAFTTKLFAGNPAAVCPLEKWLSDELMQSIAAENNLAETAFFVPKNQGYEIRWFTPTVEVDLIVTRDGSRLTLDFPGRAVESCEPTAELLANFEVKPKEVLHSGTGTYIVVLESEEQVRNYIPDFQKLSRVDRCVNITALGKNCDFVSRFFKK